MRSGSSPEGRVRLGLLAFLAAACAVLFIALGEAPIERAEIYFLDAARAMVESGNWLVPHYRGQPFYDKPPLTYWLLAASFSAFGPSLTVGRLVPALLALATLGAVFGFARRHSGTADSPTRERAALFSTIILGTSYAFMSFARLTMSDMLLTLLVLLAADGLLVADGTSRAPRAPSARAGMALVLCGTLLGLAFLTKGPIAWIFFGSLLLAIALVQRRVPRIFNFAGLLGAFLAISIAAIWFFFVYQREGAEPLQWFFLRENLQRFAAETYDSDQPFWYYLPTYLFEGLPWSLLAPFAFRFAVSGPTGTVLGRVIVLWTLLMLVPLSLSHGKIDYYILPLLPPLSALTGTYLASGTASPGALRLAAAGLLAIVLIALTFPGLPTAWAPSPNWAMTLRGTALVFLGATAWLLIRPTAQRLIVTGALTVLALGFILFAAIVPAFRAGQPVRPLLADIERERSFEPKARVVVCDDTLRVQRDILFDLRFAVVERCDLWRAVTNDRVLILASNAEETSLRRSPDIRHIATYDHLPAGVARLETLWTPPRVATLALLANFETSDPIARQKANREYKRMIAEAEAQGKR